MTRIFEDTTTEAEDVHRILVCDAPDSRKLEMISELAVAARTLTLSGLRHRHSHADEQELHRRLADMMLGKERTAELLGPLQPGWEPTYIGEGPLDNDS